MPLAILAVGFAGTGMAPNIVVNRTRGVRGVSAGSCIHRKSLHTGLHVAPPKTKAFCGERLQMLIKGTR